MATPRRYTKKASKDLHKLSLRIPPEIDKGIEKLAIKEGVSLNTMATKIMTVGLAQYTPN